MLSPSPSSQGPYAVLCELASFCLTLGHRRPVYTGALLPGDVVSKGFTCRPTDTWDRAVLAARWKGEDITILPPPAGYLISLELDFIISKEA